MTIAVSACLLGARVRFDGGHKHDHFITDALGKYADFVSFCPEDLAFGHPRPSMRVVRDKEKMIIQSNKDGSDISQTLLSASQTEQNRLIEHKLSGIIFKSKSPSCGLGSAIAYRTNGFAEGKTDGMFAKLCKEKFPLLPMEEEGRLGDAWLRENFIMQVFAYDDFEAFKAEKSSIKSLTDFHQSYKFMLQAKNEPMYRALGNIVANRDRLPLDKVMKTYELIFKKTIGEKSSIGKNRNVLEHMAGFLKDKLDRVEKTILHEQIKDYADKIIPLITPLSTLDMFARKYDVGYLLGQKFLSPYPKELALRSDIKSGK